MSAVIETFTISNVMKAAWDRVSGSKKTFWAVIGAAFLIMFILSLIFGMAKSPLMDGIMKVIGAVIQAVLSWCLLYVGINRAEDKPIEFRMIRSVLSNGKMMLNLFLVLVLRLVAFIPAVIIGGIGAIPNLPSALSFICFVVAAILYVFIAARLWLADAIVMDQQASSIDALKKSFHMTKNHVWELIGLFILTAVFLMISSIPLGIGLIWTLPFFFILYGVVYKTLK
jgi:hypothetical protein